MKQELVEKIQKLLALSKDNSNANEVESAALMAQKLMAKHDITLEDVEVEGTSNDENIGIETHWFTVPGMSWKTILAHVISTNFRCHTFSYGSKGIAFYGHATDAKIAKEVFVFVFNIGNKLATRAANEAYKRTGSMSGIYNSWIKGYLIGLKQKLAEQSLALMLVVPEDVTTAFSEFISTADKKPNRFKSDNTDTDAFKAGFEQGKTVMGKREIEGGVK